MAPGGVEKIISTNIIKKIKLAASKKLLKTNFFDATRRHGLEIFLTHSAWRRRRNFYNQIDFSSNTDGFPMRSIDFFH
jgi:hypothetical protein